MLYDASGRAIKRGAGYLRKWTCCDGGGELDLADCISITTVETEEECDAPASTDDETGRTGAL